MLTSVCWWGCHDHFLSDRLLENKLRVMGAAKGQVELVNDKGERKASGSYYTPDYIVEYIVQHTLDPILAEREATFRTAMDRCADLRRKLERVPPKATFDRLSAELAEAEREAREAFLGVKVLDPAMGSGHFLVNAVDHLTDGIIRPMQVYHDQHPKVLWEWNPIQRMIERVRQEILDETSRQGIPMNPARLDDTALLTRLVMKRCIYGVDLNPMAVELAKLSLWLHSFTVGAPLSFLDHHLRWGNSLIGTNVRTVEQSVQMTGKGQVAKMGMVSQFGLFTGPFAGLLDLAGLMIEVAEQSDATLADVRQSAEVFDEFQKGLNPYKQVLDLWVSQYFGNKAAYEFLTLYGADVLPALRGEQQVAEQYQKAVRRARELWRQKRFFHWDLEFPEVFVDLRHRNWAENPGFDAVVGNPPYDVLAEKERKEDLSSFMDFIDTDESLHPARGRKIDLFRLFVAKAISLVGLEGITGFIVPMSLLADQQTVALRKHLLTHHNFLRIDAFPQKDDPLQRVFPEAKLPTCVIVVRRSPQRQTPFLVTTHPGRSLADISGSYLCTEDDLTLLDKEGLTVPLLPSTDSLDLARKLYSDKRRSCLIGDLAPTYQGEINETTMIEFLSTDMSVGPLVLRGGNVQRYEFQPEAKQGEDKYLNVRKYEQEVGGDRVGHTNQPRIGYQRNAALDNWRRLIFTPLPTPCYCFDSVSSFLASDRKRAYALLALLNSRLLEWRFRLTSTNNHVSTHEIASLPAIRFAAAPSSQQTRMVEAGKALANKWVTARGTAEGSLLAYPYTSFLADPVGGWLAARLDGSAEQSDVVHDLLAHLAEQMVALNQEKQAEVKGFLAWLEREIGVPIGSLNNRTTLQNYLGDYQKGEAHLPLEGLLDILRQNRARLKTDPTARAFQERLSQEYQASLDKLLPLKDRLAATDRLIDLMVYRLYGLTGEDVAIVEGGGGAVSRTV